MNSVEFTIRVFLGATILIFGVLAWALGPYLQGVHLPRGGFEAPIVSIFLGTAKAKEYTIISLLFSRASISMALFSWVTIPALRFFADADFRPLARAGVIVFSWGAIGLFLLAIALHIFYYGGGNIFR